MDDPASGDSSLLPVATVDVSCGSATLVIGQTTQVLATPRDAKGNALVGRAVSWLSSDTAVAIVASRGVVTAVALGSATIIAISEGTKGAAKLTVSPLAPSVLTYTISAATYAVGTPITPNVPSSSGGAVLAYSIVPALPAGLSLNTATGVISGTPTSVSPLTTYLVSAANSVGSTMFGVTIVVKNAVTAPTDLTYSVNPAVYTVGLAITPNKPSSSGSAAVSYSLSPALPPGLSLNTATGVISGTPSAASALATYTVKATNAAGSASVGMVITVNATEVPFSTSGMTAGTRVIDFTRGSFPFGYMRVPPKNAAIIYDGIVRAQRLSWDAANPAYWIAVRGDGPWDLSAADSFMLDLGFDLSQFTTKVMVSIYVNFDSAWTNYGRWAWGSGHGHPPRIGIPLNKSSFQVLAGTADWTKVHRIEIRFGNDSAAHVAPPMTAYLYGLWANVKAKPNAVVTFDDNRVSNYTAAYQKMNALGLRGTLYVNGDGMDVGGALTLAQAKEMYDNGWDISCHTFDHIHLARRFASLTRSGTTSTAKLTVPHGYAVGNTFTIDGSDIGWCGRARWLMEPRTGWLVSIGAVSGQRAAA